MRPPRIHLGARRNPFALCQRTNALTAGNYAIRPRASTYVGRGSTRTRIRKASESDSLLAFPFATSLAEMHQSRRRTKLSLGKPAIATFAQAAVANFPVLRYVANTGRKRAVILWPRNALAANFSSRLRPSVPGNWILRKNLARTIPNFSFLLRSDGRPGPFTPV